MPKLRVQSFAISIDGYGAGPDQDLRNPIGVRGTELMEWFFHTRVWRKMHGLDGGETGVDNDIAEQGFAGIGAWILGRNMFGPCLSKQAGVRPNGPRDHELVPYERIRYTHRFDDPNLPGKILRRYPRWTKE